MTTVDGTEAAERAKPTFLYDDGCPLCRSYTATFTALGWAERAPFSTIDDATLEALDMQRARHHIPLHDAATGETRYGLDGILDVVADELPLLTPVVRHRHVRTALDGLYWFITYNRRHVVSAPPPATGVDCAPDFEPAPVATYLAFCSAGATAAALKAGTGAATAAAALGAASLMSRRDPSWQINGMQAAGHVGSVTLASAATGLAVKAATGRTALAAAGLALVAARKMWLRRWMLRRREVVRPAR